MNTGVYQSGAQERKEPEASGPDWFEIAGLALVADGRISEERFRRAMEVARKAVDRE